MPKSTDLISVPWLLATLALLALAGASWLAPTPMAGFSAAVVCMAACLAAFMTLNGHRSRR